MTSIEVKQGKYYVVDGELPKKPDDKEFRKTDDLNGFLKLDIEYHQSLKSLPRIEVHPNSTNKLEHLLCDMLDEDQPDREDLIPDGIYEVPCKWEMKKEILSSVINTHAQGSVPVEYALLIEDKPKHLPVGDTMQDQMMTVLDQMGLKSTTSTWIKIEL